MSGLGVKMVPMTENINFGRHGATFATYAAIGVATVVPLDDPKYFHPTDPAGDMVLDLYLSTNRYLAAEFVGTLLTEIQRRPGGASRTLEELLSWLPLALPPTSDEIRQELIQFLRLSVPNV